MFPHTPVIQPALVNHVLPSMAVPYTFPTSIEILECVGGGGGVQHHLHMSAPYYCRR